MLGQPMFLPSPVVVGVRVRGALPAGTTATDLVLTLTQMLRAHGVVGRFVEFFGDGCSSLERRGPRDALEHVPRVRGHVRVLPGRRRDPALPPRSPAGATWSISSSATRRSRGCSARDGDPEPTFTEIARARPRRDRALGRRPEAAAGPRRAVAGVGFVRRGVPRPARTRPRRVRGRPAPRGGRERRGRGRSRRDRRAGFGGAGGAQPRRRPSRLGRDRRDHELHEHVEPLRDARRRPAREEGRRGGPGHQAVGEDVARAGFARRDRLPRRGRAHALPRQARVLAGGVRVHDVHRELRAAAGGGGGRRDPERPRRGRRALGQPQLRGPDPSAGPGELPRVPAARGRVRPRGPRRRRPDERTARDVGGRDAGVLAGPVAHARGGPRRDRGVGLTRTVRARVRADLRRRRPLARAPHARGSGLRVGSELDLRARAAVLRGPRTDAGRTRRPRRRARASSRSATRSRPTTSRRRARSSRTRPPGGTCSTTASNSATSTRTARGEATTR